MVTPFAIRCPIEVFFGWGAFADIGTHAAGLGRRALLVIGQRALRKSGKLDQAIGMLNSAKVDVVLFEGVEPEPSVETVGRAVNTLKQASCDVVVAIGGGSVLDVGKAVAAVAYADGTLEEFMAGKAVSGPAVPVIAIPTTAGTGAEVTPNAVLSDLSLGVKTSIRGRTLMPQMAVVDPELTTTMPPRETALTGIDALAQAIESFVSKGANEYSDPLALKAIGLGGQWLRAAVTDGANREAREAMSLCSLLAGLALASARLGLVHGIAHPMGARYRLPHGLACAMLLPHVIRYNLEAAQSKLTVAAHSLGLAGMTPARDLADWVQELCADIDAMPHLSEFGASEADLDELIPPTLSSGSTKHNPREVDEAGVREVLRALL